MPKRSDRASSGDWRGLADDVARCVKRPIIPRGPDRDRHGTRLHDAAARDRQAILRRAIRHLTSRVIL